MRATVIAFISILLVSPVVAKPNILVILADDLGKEGLSFYGNPVHSTPNLDRMASEGMVYTNMFVEPNCSPTRAAFLTGEHPWKTGIDHVISEGENTCLDPYLPNVARTLSEAGYTTAAAGKWHVCGTFLDNLAHPWQVGFDGYALLGRQSHENNVYERYFDPLVVYKDAGVPFVELVQETAFSPDLFASWISGFIQTSPEPWFVYWAMNLVHDPMIDPWLMIAGKNKHRTEMISYMDKLIGEVVPLNTIVIFLGDNGSQVWTGGGKGTAKDSGTNVPMIVHGLGQGTDHRLISIVDLHSTIAEIAGVISPNTDGQSFLSTERDHVISYTVKNGMVRMVRDRRYKIRRDPWKVYDLSWDTDENEPITNNDVKKRLKGYWRDACGPIPESPISCSPFPDLITNGR